MLGQPLEENAPIFGNFGLVDSRQTLFGFFCVFDKDLRNNLAKIFCTDLRDQTGVPTQPMATGAGGRNLG